MFPQNFILPNNFIDMAKMPSFPMSPMSPMFFSPMMTDSPNSKVIDMSKMPPFPLPPMFFSPMQPGSPDSGISSLNVSPQSLFNYSFSPMGFMASPLPRERKKRGRDDYCKLCRKKIAEDGRRSQGPSRHVLQHHMDIPKFFCPHCEFASKYDKAHISTHMRCMHHGMGGEVRIADDAIYTAKFKKVRERCFGAGEEVETEEADSPSSSTSSPSAFSIDSLLSAQSTVPPPPTPPATLPVPPADPQLPQ